MMGMNAPLRHALLALSLLFPLSLTAADKKAAKTEPAAAGDHEAATRLQVFLDRAN
ncbi:MAG: hypothetical protein JWR15_3467, partial [Prosthecobacter sp.]|nr:hypothetical protein [Prosthecobacter sp.]